MKTLKQIEWLEKLNSLPQVVASRFQKGMIPHNINSEYIGLPRNKHRQPLVPCVDCGETMVIAYSKTRRCKKCAYKFRTENQTKRVWASGYVYTDGGNRPKPLHIKKAEQVLGRELKYPECVHHINLHKDDNRNCNLVICDNKYHKFLHQRYALLFAERRFNYVPFGE